VGRSAEVPRVPGQTGGDDAGCSILHVDMDAFFASVEIKRRPELRGKPVIVGGRVRGVVAAASYEARRFGVRSAMSTAHALRLCPHAVLLPPDRQAYSAASSEVMAILRSMTPLVEPLSLDEAFLDVSGVQRLLGRPALIAASIRAQVLERLGLTCSVGVAPTKFVAKVASARCKPDGMLVVASADVLAFLHPLPVTVLWGVGERTAEPLRRLGIRTIGDLAATPLDTLRRAVGVGGADHLAELAAGRDPRSVRAREVEKSVSSDHTADADLTDDAEVERQLLRHAADVCARLRSRELASRTIGIKIRFADFRTVTRVRTLPSWTTSTSVVHAAAVELYRSLRLDQPRIRLVGVKAENLRALGQVAEQLTLDGATAAVPTSPSAGGEAIDVDPSRAYGHETAQTAAQIAADRVADDVRRRFGDQALGYGSLLAAVSATPRRVVLMQDNSAVRFPKP
jgi:DNA polymerase-4